MEYKTKQYEINYQYTIYCNKDAYDSYFNPYRTAQDIYKVNGFSACDAINKLLAYCRTSGRNNVYLFSCEEK